MNETALAVADVIATHSSLGALCTCGARLPTARLDTPRWFAEHVAESLAPIVAARVAEAVEQERATWAAKIEPPVARYNNRDIWGAATGRLRAILAADDTEAQREAGR